MSWADDSSVGEMTTRREIAEPPSGVQSGNFRVALKTPKISSSDSKEA